MDIVIPYSLTQPLTEINSGDINNPATMYTSFISDFTDDLIPIYSLSSGQVYGESSYIQPVLRTYGSLYKTTNLYKSIIPKNNEYIAEINENKWKPIYDNYDSPSLTAMWKYQLSRDADTFIGYINNRNITANHGKIYKNLINNNYTIPGSDNTWQFSDYLNSHSFLRQDTNLGLTKLYKNSKFSIIKPSNINKIALLGAENISRITVIEAPIDSVNFTQDNSLKDTPITWPGIPGLDIPPIPLGSSSEWKSCAYNEVDDVLVVIGRNSQENKYLIKYITNFVKNSLSNETIFSTGSFFNWQLGSLEKTQHWINTSDNLELTKVHYSKSFSKFYAIGKNLQTNDSCILYSKDGISWKYCQIWPGPGNPNIQSEFVDIIDASNDIVACTDRHLLYTSDGENWVISWEPGPWYPDFKFYQLAYVDGNVPQRRYIYATVESGISTEGELWCFCKSDNYSLRDTGVPSWRNVNYPASVWTGLPRSNTKLSVYYHKYIDCLLVGCVNSFKIIFNPSKIYVTQFDADTPTNLNYLKTVNINHTGLETYTPIAIDYNIGDGLYLVMSNGADYQIIKTKVNSVPLGADTWNISGRPFEVYVNELNDVIDNPTPVIYQSLWQISGIFNNLVSLFNIPKLGIMGFLLSDGGLNYQSSLQNFTTNLNIETEYTEYQPIININLSNNLSRIYFYIELKKGKDIGYIKNLIAGNNETIGLAQLNSSFNIIDYSKKDIDEFGNINIVQRPYRETYSINLLVSADNTTQIYEKLVSIRNTSCLWIPAPKSTDYSYGFLSVYGFFKDFSIDITYPEYVFCSMTIESISQF